MAPRDDATLQRRGERSKNGACGAPRGASGAMAPRSAATSPSMRVQSWGSSSEAREGPRPTTAPGVGAAASCGSSPRQSSPSPRPGPGCLLALLAWASSAMASGRNSQAQREPEGLRRGRLGESYSDVFEAGGDEIVGPPRRTELSAGEALSRSCLNLDGPNGRRPTARSHQTGPYALRIVSWPSRPLPRPRVLGATPRRRLHARRVRNSTT